MGILTPLHLVCEEEKAKEFHPTVSIKMILRMPSKSGPDFSINPPS
jgi:hypothetical protein